MPVEEQKSIENSVAVPEYRKIKIGEKGPNGYPTRYKAPVVTMPMKPRAGAKFEVDEAVMKKIRLDQKILAGQNIKGIPIRFLSDKIEDVLYVYRAMYNSSGRALCKSDLGNEKATRWATAKDPGADKGTKQGKFFILNEPVQVDCNKKCPMWPKDGNKTDCTWHAILTTQLEDDPVIPHPTRYRSSGWTVINNIRGSLNKISAVTGGILANIPLLFVESEIESRTAKGEKRTHPVISIMFRGTMTDLREAAIRELESRRRLSAAKAGRPVLELDKDYAVGNLPVAAQTFESDAGGAVDDPDEFVDLDGEDVQVIDAPSAPRAGGDDDEFDSESADGQMAKAEAEVKELAKSTGTTQRALDAIIDKHKGDFAAVAAELRKMHGKATEPAAKTEPKQEAKAEPKDPVLPPQPAATADVDDDQWDVGDESSEQSETEEQPEAVAAAEELPEEDPPAEAEAVATPEVEDEFDIFQDEE